MLGIEEILQIHPLLWNMDTEIEDVGVLNVRNNLYSSIEHQVLRCKSRHELREFI